MYIQLFDPMVHFISIHFVHMHVYNEIQVTQILPIRNFCVSQGPIMRHKSQELFLGVTII